MAGGQVIKLSSSSSIKFDQASASITGSGKHILINLASLAGPRKVQDPSCHDVWIKFGIFLQNATSETWTKIGPGDKGLRNLRIKIDTQSCKLLSRYLALNFIFMCSEHCSIVGRLRRQT